MQKIAFSLFLSFCCKINCTKLQTRPVLDLCSPGCLLVHIPRMTKTKENDQNDEELFVRENEALQDSKCSGLENQTEPLVVRIDYFWKF